MWIRIQPSLKADPDPAFFGSNRLMWIRIQHSLNVNPDPPFSLPCLKFYFFLYENCKLLTEIVGGT